MIDRPQCVCANCFAVWRARRPRPPALYCWHQNSAARLRPEGWQEMKGVRKSELAALREGGLL